LPESPLSQALKYQLPKLAINTGKLSLKLGSASVARLSVSCGAQQSEPVTPNGSNSSPSDLSRSAPIPIPDSQPRYCDFGFDLMDDAELDGTCHMASACARRCETEDYEAACSSQPASSYVACPTLESDLLFDLESFASCAQQLQSLASCRPACNITSVLV
jgi:hypothetical protein